MRIGFDVSQTGSTSKAGCGFYAQSLIACLIKKTQLLYQIVILPSFGDFYFDEQFQNQANSKVEGHLELGPTHANVKEAGQFWNSAALESSLPNLDIIHSNNFWCPLGISKAKLIYTLYDLGFLENPQSWTTEVNRIGCFEGAFRASLEADWIVAISDFSKNHFLRLFPYFPAERIQIIYPCTRFDNFLIETPIPERFQGLERQSFWLTVGTIEPRKNQRMLLKAYSTFIGLGGKPFPLVFAGGMGWMMEDFVQEIKQLGLSNFVIRLGYVSDKELRWLYQNCLANLYPSHFEGFGLPILEGMQFGAPTISSNTTSMPEVAGLAAILLDPNGPDQWAKSMLRIATDPILRESLGSAALERSRKFSWQKSAQELTELYEKALLSPKRSTLS